MICLAVWFYALLHVVSWYLRLIIPSTIYTAMDQQDSINAYQWVNGFKLHRRVYGIEMFTLDEMRAEVVRVLKDSVEVRGSLTRDNNNVSVKEEHKPFGATHDGQHRVQLLILSNSVEILLTEGMYSLASNLASAPQLCVMLGHSHYQGEVRSICDVSRIVLEGFAYCK